MEERKLNFNAPFLSVRRFSTASVSSNEKSGKRIESSLSNRRHTTPFYASDLSLDQVTEPVSIPFIWEQIPGRPKDDSGFEPQAPEEASVTPRLPPGRILDIIKYPLERNFEAQNAARLQIETCSSNENVMRLEGSKERINEIGGSDLEDEDDLYSDALDTLSPTDSLSMSCSVSGLSGFDDHCVVKPSGTFSTDPQTRDFMMSRFLPAAKAMALEPSQYASKKQLVVVEPEQPRENKKVVSEGRRLPINQYGYNIIPHYGQDIEDEESEDEDEYDNITNISKKGCGLLPHLCFKNSLCLLNPVPGLKDRTHSSTYSTRVFGKPSKSACIESHSQTVKKHVWDSFHKRKTDSGVKSPRLSANENKLSCGSNRLITSSSGQLTRSWSSSPNRRPGCISPNRNAASRSPFHGVGFLGTPKEAENFNPNRLKSQELLFPTSTRQSSGSMSPAVEKTLYVHTINFSQISSSNSSFSETKGWMDSVGEDLGTSSGIRGIEDTDTVESSIQDVKRLSISKGECISEPNTLVSVDANQSSFSKALYLKGAANMMDDKLQELDQECKSLVCIKVTADVSTSYNQILKADDPGKAGAGSELSLLPPPLPKKPSESWLWRTMPSVTSRNPFSNSHLTTRFNPKKQDSETPSNITKWETIVKTSYLHHDHVRYSEELITHVPHHSKT